MWPNRLVDPSLSALTIDAASLYGCTQGCNYGNLSSVAFPSANRIYYIPFVTPCDILVYQMQIINGSSISGNFILGLYDANFNKILDTGSVAQSGASALQVVNITDTLLGIGQFYAAVQMDNGTGSFNVIAPTNLAATYALGVAQESAGSFAMPSVATFSPILNSYIPLVGIEGAVVF